jgi:periplasmic protein TonB
VTNPVSLQLAIAVLEDTMFADSLLESNLSRTHRGWTTVVSFAMQTLGVAILLMLPLLYTEGLPRLHLLSVSAPIGPPRGEPPAAQQHSAVRQGQSNLFHGIVVSPRSIPIGVKPIIEDSVPQVEACNVCVPGSTNTGNGANSVIDSIGVAPAIVPPPPPPVAHPPRISHMMEGNLIYKVQPVYPPLARAARIQGAVVIRAVISRNGTIENLQTLSGHPMLVGAALDAVRQWRYRPYILNGDPVEVETQVTVNFALSGG